MTLVKLNRKPFENNFNNLVDDFFAELPGIFNNNVSQSQWKGHAPVNIKESAKNFQLELVAPGFEKTDFKISLDQNILTVAAEKKEEGKNENEKQVRREYSFQSFKRSFTIDEKVDATNIDASYINGVLTLNLPRKEAVKVSATEIAIK